MSKKKAKIIKLFTIIFLLLSFLITLKNYIYYNNYFHYNKDKLNLIKEYIIGNELKGSLYLDDISNEDINMGLKKYSGKLGDCYKNEKCEYLSNLLNDIGVVGINYFSHDNENNYYGKKGDFILIKIQSKIHGYKFNEILFSVGYFNGKSEMEKFNGSRYSRIIKIFNENWGIVNFRFGDNFGAFG